MRMLPVNQGGYPLDSIVSLSCLSSESIRGVEWLPARVLCGFFPCISMVGGIEDSECAYSRQPHNFRVRRWVKFSCSALWRILDARVDPIRIVVSDVVPEKPN